MEDYEENSFQNSRYYVKKGEPIIVEGKPIVIPDVESYELSSTPTSGATFDPSSIVSAIDKITTFEFDFISFIEEYKEKIPRIPEELSIKNLKNVFKKKDLVFVFGSGISIQQGVPDWNKLLIELMAKAIAEEMNIGIIQARIYAEVYVKQLSTNPLIIARHIRNHMGGGLSLESKTKELIYKKISQNPSPLFKEILEFFKRTTVKKGVDSVITFNYDNLLEYFCKNNTPLIPFRSIYSKKMDESGIGLPIYHVHGYLPKEKRKRWYDNS